MDKRLPPEIWYKINKFVWWNEWKQRNHRCMIEVRNKTSRLKWQLGWIDKTTIGMLPMVDWVDYNIITPFHYVVVWDVRLGRWKLGQGI